MSYFKNAPHNTLVTQNIEFNLNILKMKKLLVLFLFVGLVCNTYAFNNVITNSVNDTEQTVFAENTQEVTTSVTDFNCDIQNVAVYLSMEKITFEGMVHPVGKEINDMKLNWTKTEDRKPQNYNGFNPPYISCVVFSCNPESPNGGVIETCRWDVKNECWFKDDIRANWLLQPPYKITHYADDVESPFAI